MSPAAFADQPPLRLSRYVVRRRAAPKAANDNRPEHASALWRWALAAAPTVAVVVIAATLL